MKVIETFNSASHVGCSLCVPGVITTAVLPQKITISYLQAHGGLCMDRNRIAPTQLSIGVHTAPRPKSRSLSERLFGRSVYESLFFIKHLFR